MPELTIKANGRLVCPEAGLTSRQYSVVQSMPRQCYSEKERHFTFIQTPLAASQLVAAGFDLPDATKQLYDRWEQFRTSVARPRQSYAGLLKSTPWKHQPLAIDWIERCPSPYMDMGMGTGKSLCTIAGIAALGHKRTLILAPKAVVNVWPREFRAHAHDDQFNVIPLGDGYGSVAKKAAAARAGLSRGGNVVIVINYESAHRDAFADWADTVKWDCVVGDELHRCKSSTGSAAKFARNLHKGQGIGLSGTMMPHSPMDIWSQFAFLEPALFGTSYMLFEKRYAVKGRFKENVRFVNLDEMHEKIKLLTFSVSSDVLDLPPATHQQFRFRFSDKVMKAYRSVRRELFARIQDGVVTADNVLVRGLRLQQLTSGFYFDDVTQKEVELDHQPKIEALADWLDAIPRDEKFVVFTRFIRDARAVEKHLVDSGYKVGMLVGGCNQLTQDATFDTRYDCYVVNIASGGVGVDLTAANHAFYYSVSWNAGDYEQSLRRLLRPGQVRNVHFGHAICEGTVDDEIYEAFLERRDLADVVIRGLTKEV